MKNTFRNGWTTAEEEEQFNFNNKHIEFEFFDKPSIYIFIRRFPRNLEIAVVSLLHMIKQKTTFTQIFQYFKKEWMRLLQFQINLNKNRNETLQFSLVCLSFTYDV